MDVLDFISDKCIHAYNSHYHRPNRPRHRTPHDPEDPHSCLVHWLPSFHSTRVFHRSTASLPETTETRPSVLRSRTSHHDRDSRGLSWSSSGTGSCSSRWPRRGPRPGPGTCCGPGSSSPARWSICSSLLCDGNTSNPRHNFWLKNFQIQKLRNIIKKREISSSAQ